MLKAMVIFDFLGRQTFFQEAFALWRPLPWALATHLHIPDIVVGNGTLL